ncbi:MAG: hypothetical protein ABR567_07875 [Myxococcales bacterium]
MLRLLLALSAAAAVLVAGAYAGGAFSSAQAAKGRPARVSDEQPYGKEPQAGEIAVGDALTVNGQPMQMSIFFTSDEPSRVVHFYAEAFRARGLTPVLSEVHVSAFDPKDGWQRFVTAMPQGDGQTMVMIGATNPRRPPRFMKAAEAAGFPVPKENRGFLGYTSEDMGNKAETAQFMSPLAPAAVADFYRRELAAKGWTERRQDASQDLITFSRGGEILSVAMQALEEKSGAAVFVTRTQEGVR